MFEISANFLTLCNMFSLDRYIAMEGRESAGQITYYQTFLVQSDKRVLQNIREKALGITTTLTEDEYLQLETERQSVVEQLRILGV